MDYYTKGEHILTTMRLNSNFFILLLITAEISCNLGQIFPKGPIIRQVHSDINITCTLKDTVEPPKSDLLSFVIGDAEVEVEVPSENIKILNNRTIQLSLRDVETMNKRITCKWNGTMGVDMRNIMVGTQPTEITDFGCLSYDFNYFECKFTKSANPVKTTYNLTYLVQTSLYNCPDLDKNSPIYVCNITMKNQGYRSVHDIYNFTLQSINHLGSRIDNFIISHFSSVIPGKPSVNITNIEPSSAVLMWDVKKPLYSDTGLVYDITLLQDINIVSVHNKGIWKSLDTSNINSTLIKNQYKLSDLYPHTWYEVQLSLKVANAIDIPDMWTKTNTTFQTKSREPDEPPHVDIGSFQPPSNYNTNITSLVIYWRGVPKYKENGGDIHYVIKDVKMNGKEVNIKPKEISQYSAKFELPKADYEFTIYTANEKGISNVGTILHVPKRDYPLPQQIKKISKEHGYILMWSEPDGDILVKDYTIFSCISKSETFDQCESGFNFTHVSRDSRNITYKTTQHEQMNFAISANYFNASSGMVWARCTAVESSDFGIMEPKGIPTNGTTIKLDWSLECVYSAIVEGFRLSYCPITINASCITSMKTLNISGENREYYLHNLTPYTTYRIWMSMYSVTKQGPESNKPLEITTLESSPTPPRQLTILNFTDHSIGLRWEPPELFNGPLRYYKIFYNNENVRIEVERLTNQSVIVANLDKLSSYKYYKIYVIASTGSFDSLPSNDYFVRTEIGTPGSLEQPKFNTEDQMSSMTVSWRPPAVPSGPIDYYELKTSIFKESKFLLDRTLRINGTQCTMRLPRDTICQNHSHRFEFYVRAVNAIYKKEGDGENIKHAKVQTLMYDPFAIQCDEDNHEISSWYEKNEDNMIFLKSEWSTALMHYCYYAVDSSHAVTIIVSLFSFATLSICIYFLCKKYIKMKNIGIAFPPGLADLDQVSRPKGCDNVITRDDIAHSDESLYKNENHHLLANNRIDSGYLNGLDCTDKSETVDFDDSSEIVVIRNDDDNSSGHAESVEMSDMSENSPAESPNINLREKSMHPAPTSIPFMNPIIINGYVQHQSFQKPPEPPIFNYTQMSTLDNSKIPTNLTTTENESSKHKEPSSINSSIQENICGYVTHKQLSEFGHRQQ